MVQLTDMATAGLPQEIRPEESEMIIEGYVSVRGDVRGTQHQRRQADQGGCSITLMWNDDGRPLFARESIPRAELLND